MRTESNYDAHITREPNPPIIVGYCKNCCHHIQKGDKTECPCGAIRHIGCMYTCATEGCVVRGCKDCMKSNIDGGLICEDCHNKLTEERKKFVEKLETAMCKHLNENGYNISRPSRQTLHNDTSHTFTTPGQRTIVMYIGKEIAE